MAAARQGGRCNFHLLEDSDTESDSEADGESEGDDSSSPESDAAGSQDSSCPCCGQAMYSAHPGTKCSNPAGRQCANPRKRRWTCRSCWKSFCISCYASVANIADDSAGDWYQVSTGSRGHHPSRKKKKKAKAAEDVEANSVAAFCQRWEQPAWVNQTLSAMHPGDVHPLLAILSTELDKHPDADVGDLITRYRTSRPRYRLSKVLCDELEEWVAELRLIDIKRTCLLDACSRSDETYVRYLMNQRNFLKDCQSGEIEDPASLATSIMRSKERKDYDLKIAAFARQFKLSLESQRRLGELRPRVGSNFIERHRNNKNHGTNMADSMLFKEIMELWRTEMEDKQRRMQKDKSMPSHRTNPTVRNAAIVDQWESSEDDDDTEQPWMKPSHGTLSGPKLQAFGENDAHERTRFLGGHLSSEEEDEDEDDEEDELMPLPSCFKNTSASSSSKAKWDQDDAPTITMLRTSTSEWLQNDRKAGGARIAIPSHFVVVVDVSGSMTERDCQVTGRAEKLTRMDAVLLVVRELADQSRACDDQMSFITFSDKAYAHFQRLPLKEAQRSLKDLASLRPQGGTQYGEGLRRAARCVDEDIGKRPADVIFLSDGEPNDPEQMLPALAALLKTRPRKELKVYCIGFGAGSTAAAGVRMKGAARSGHNQDEEPPFAYMQQLAQLGNGAFHVAGSSVASLRGAFEAVSSTIYSTRTTSKLGSSVLSKADETASSTNCLGRESATSLKAYCNGVLDRKAVRTSEVPDQVKLKASREDLREKDVVFELQSCKFDFNADLGFREVEADRVSFEFDGRRFKETVQRTNVQIRKQPFTKGAMRNVYGMRDEQLNHNYLAKRTIFEGEDIKDPEGTVDVFAKQTALAHYYARLFRNDCEKAAGIELVLEFVRCFAYRPTRAEDNDLGGFCGERYLSGNFVKLTSNAGFVNREEYGAHANVAEAFSHYTFHRSGGAVLVADIQGVCAGKKAPHQTANGPSKDDQDRKWFLSDPQVLTDGCSYNFGNNNSKAGRGDLGMRGMQMFFKTHRCSWLCKALQMSQICDIKEPTMQCYIPGSMLVLCGIYGWKGTLVHDIRRQSGATLIQLPRYAHAEWMHINIHAPSISSAREAASLVKIRCRELIVKFVSILNVPEQVHWSTETWRAQRARWIRESGGAQIVLYRGGSFIKPQAMDDPVKQIWFFPKELEPGKRQDTLSWRERDKAKHMAADFMERFPVFQADNLQYDEDLDQPAAGISTGLDVYDYVMQDAEKVKQKKRKPTDADQHWMSSAASRRDHEWRSWPAGAPEQIPPAPADPPPPPCAQSLSSASSMPSSSMPYANEVAASSSNQSESMEASYQWLVDTEWMDRQAFYVVRASSCGKGVFQVSKFFPRDKWKFDINLYVRKGTIYWGEEARWYLKELSEDRIMWAGKSDMSWFRAQARSVCPAKPAPIGVPKWQVKNYANPAGLEAAPVNAQKSVSPPPPPQQPPVQCSTRWSDLPEEHGSSSEELHASDDLQELDEASIQNAYREHSAGRVWTQYDDGTGMMWWHNAYNDNSFLESDEKWTKYKAPNDGRLYWYCAESGDHFFVDTGCPW